MQNNVTELTQKLLRALDKNYNVIDMPTVIEIVSLLEKVTITKELLETTRLGKHVNELRRKTDNDALSKRAKELVKKWRNIVLPEPNGHLKTTTPSSSQQQQQQDDDKTRKRQILGSTTPTTTTLEQSIKRQKINGQTTEYDFSDNSNSSFKDVINTSATTTTTIITPPKNVINTDVNSNNNNNSRVLATNQQQQQQEDDEPQLEQQLPKKRGRKKGSKNHKNLIVEAETSFSNKLAVSRGCHSKVKTTQELIASLQNKTNSLFSNSSSNNNNNNNNNNTTKIKEDLNIRAAKLTERVSIIDQKLNTNSNRYKNSQKNKTINNRNLLESGSFVNNNNNNNDNDEIIIVDDIDTTTTTSTKIDDDVDVDIDDDDDDTNNETDTNEFNNNNNNNRINDNDDNNKVKSLSVEEALKLLPPIDKNVILNDNNDDEPVCTCILNEIHIDKIEDDDVDDDNIDNNLQQKQSSQLLKYEFIDKIDCPARNYINNKLNNNNININDLHTKYLENINGNYSINNYKQLPEMTNNGLLYVNVVPNFNNIPKDVKLLKQFDGENYKKYSISEDDDNINNNNDTNSDDNNERTSDNIVNNNNNNNNDDDSGRIFREWHEVVDVPSYNGEILKILPYVIID